MFDDYIDRSLSREIVCHSLRLLGLYDVGLQEHASHNQGQVLFANGLDAESAAFAHKSAKSGQVQVVLSPSVAFCKTLGIDFHERPMTSTPFVLANETAIWSQLRSLHNYRTFEASPKVDCEPILLDPDGGAIWLWLPIGEAGILLIGSRLAEDLVRFRQGDLVQAESNQSRINLAPGSKQPDDYLYQDQIKGGGKYNRQADWLSRALAGLLSEWTGIPLSPLLPNNAIGIVVVTGDDDQAALDKYKMQRKLLANLTGIDGHVMNGSLLPARVSNGDMLTGHWSVPTSISDEVFFAFGMSPHQSLDCVLDAAEAIWMAKLPGVLVVNLQSHNLEKTKPIQDIILALSHAGFLLWNIQDCVNWFNSRDVMSELPKQLSEEGANSSIKQSSTLFKKTFERLNYRAKNVFPLKSRKREDENKALTREHFFLSSWVEPPRNAWSSFDRTPWRHPWLTNTNLKRMKDFSQEYISRLMQVRETLPNVERRYAFVNNMANALYCRAVPLRRQGIKIDMFLHPHDDFVMSAPEWEEFDGFLTSEETNISQLTLAEQKQLPNVANVLRIRDIKSDVGELKSISLMPDFVRLRDFLRYQGYLSYLPLLERLQQYDALYSSHAPYLAYLSNRPYLVAQNGGDIWYEAARDDVIGRLQRLAFLKGSAFLASNPWSFAHARRYGMNNMLYVPMMLDQDDYSPGEDAIRKEWESQSGGDFFVLSTARQDDRVKGTTMAIDAFQSFSSDHPGARLVISAWGNDHQQYLETFRERGIADKVIILPLSGKKRVVKYLRAADCLLDQFVIGYFGATALEAMACGLPVIMRLEDAHYAAICETGAPPILNAATKDEIEMHLRTLFSYPERRLESGVLLREWFIDNHGSERWSSTYEGLLELTASGYSFDYSDSPLSEPLFIAEREYHEAELAAAPVFPNYK